MGKKKLEAKFEACLEIPVCISEEGEKDSGGGRAEHVQEKGIICRHGFFIDFFFLMVWVSSTQLAKPFLRYGDEHSSWS